MDKRIHNRMQQFRNHPQIRIEIYLYKYKQNIIKKTKRSKNKKKNEKVNQS
jgi:hypothetical protein